MPCGYAQPSRLYRLPLLGSNSDLSGRSISTMLLVDGDRRSQALVRFWFAVPIPHYPEAYVFSLACLMLCTSQGEMLAVTKSASFQNGATWIRWVVGSTCSMHMGLCIMYMYMYLLLDGFGDTYVKLVRDRVDCVSARILEEYWSWYFYSSSSSSCSKFSYQYLSNIRSCQHLSGATHRPQRHHLSRYEIQTQPTECDVCSI